MAAVAAACAGAAADEQQPAAMKLRRPQHQEQARQMEQMLQPALHAELEFIRRVCGELDPDAKRAIKAAAEEAIREAAAAFATQELRPRRRSAELRSILADKLGGVVERHVPADVAAEWRRELDARRERQAETARLLVVARLDPVLELTAEQRDAILADLRSRWDDEWLCGLNDTGNISVNGRRLAPDYAAAAIVPHLDDRQRRAWDEWVQAAAWRHQRLAPRSLVGPGLREADPWWTE
jgi:hypothetical protein